MSENIWTDLAAPLPSSAIEWRQDGKPTERGGKYFARFVPYVTTQYVRERLDALAAGEWSTHMTRDPDAHDGNGVVIYSCKCALVILGVRREDIGEGDSPKVAATDAFKRAAMRFGIAHELYSFGQNWVEVDGNGKFAKALVDPQANYEAKKAGGQVTHPAIAKAAAASPAEAKAVVARAEAALAAVEAVRAEEGASNADVPHCPKCSGKMWDNRVGKKNPKAPDFKCRDKSCDGVVWPPKGGAAPKPAAPPSYASINGSMDDDNSPLPF